MGVINALPFFGTNVKGFDTSPMYINYCQYPSMGRKRRMTKGRALSKSKPNKHINTSQSGADTQCRANNNEDTLPMTREYYYIYSLNDKRGLFEKHSSTLLSDIKRVLTNKLSHVS
ncbi:hypothetical protein LguiB_007156 [Lonicera macranthoides]